MPFMAKYECLGCPFKTNSWEAMVAHAKDVHGQDI
jgi:hypothetical protein